MQVLSFLSTDPQLRFFQISLIILAAVSVWLVLYVTRDTILRSKSFLFQFFAIALTALLPVLGFFLYLLMRPARTIKEREMEEMLLELTEGGVMMKKGPKMKAPEEGSDD